MNLTDIYKWEIEIEDGTVIEQEKNKKEWRAYLKGKFHPTELITRVSFKSQYKGYQEHSCLIDIRKGQRFLKRFIRGFIKVGKNGIFEYLHVCVTNSYRMYLFSSTGNILITDRNFELYL